METALIFRQGAQPPRPITERPEFKEYLKREGLTLAEWESKQTAGRDIDGQVLRLQLRKLQQQFAQRKLT